MPGLMNQYNNAIWDSLPSYGEVAPIVGADFYHYKNKFWLHAYGNYLLPAHKYLKGEDQFSYLHRDCWGVGGHIEDCEEAQWDDFQVGLMFGWKVSNAIGVFIEGEYTKFWNSRIYNTNFGVNLTFK